MDTPPRPGDNTHTARFEAEAARQPSLARAPETIAEVRISAAAGRVVPSHEARARIDSLDTDHDLPAHRSGQ